MRTAMIHQPTYIYLIKKGVLNRKIRKNLFDKLLSGVRTTDYIPMNKHNKAILTKTVEHVIILRKHTHVIYNVKNTTEKDNRYMVATIKLIRSGLMNPAISEEEGMAYIIEIDEVVEVGEFVSYDEIIQRLNL